MGGYDIEKWKREFAGRYGLELRDDKAVYYCGEIVISEWNCVSFQLWHGMSLRHEKFKFEGDGIFFLETKNDCYEFEKVFLEYRKVFKMIGDSFPETDYEEINDVIRSLYLICYAFGSVEWMAKRIYEKKKEEKRSNEKNL